MRQILVIRFSSLGDLCLLGAALARWSDLPGAGDRRITLVTKAAFAPLMRQMRGVDEVLELENSSRGELHRLAGEIQSRHWDSVLDAHGTLRSLLLLARCGLRSDARLAKDTVARLAYLRWHGDSNALHRTMSDRFDALLGTSGIESSPALDTDNAEREIRLGIAPGAQWASKQWPSERFAALIERFAATSSAPLSIFLGPRESGWYAGSQLERVAAALPKCQIFENRTLPEVARELARCALLVTNDSGLMHVAEATGTPVVALFGPTVRQWGFFPRLPGSSVLEKVLPCRPCSRNGKRSCHRGDLACLKQIEVDEVYSRIRESRSWPPLAEMS